MKTYKIDTCIMVSMYYGNFGAVFQAFKLFYVLLIIKVWFL